ncbi:MAG: alpha/beta hydrolase [Acidobacteriota bacterium]|nr:MAG: alpha/beta hydrolase [Acidobacteriota bacterium]
MLCISSGSCQNESQSEQPAVEQSPEVTADSGTIAAGRWNLRYRVEGTGTPALVIGSSLYYPRAFSPELRSHLKMAFVDHRGFAPAIPGPFDPPTDFDLDVLIDDIERARTELGWGRVVAIGHSGHSFMALEYAKKYPDSVSHVVMIGIGPDISPAALEATERNWEETASAERKALLEESLKRHPDSELESLSESEAFILDYVRRGPRIWYDPAFDSSPLWEGMDVNTQMFDYVWGNLFRNIDITQGLEELDRPVFLALGRFDYLVPPPEAWEPLRPHFKDLTVQVFEKSGHTPQLEQPSEFDAALLDWIHSRE